LPPPTLREDDLVWLPLAAIESAPLPAPILALLREIDRPGKERDGTPPKGRGGRHGKAA
jgi:hypothetical protein